MERELICIVCPKGCHLKVDIENEKVTGNTCKRGEIYGLNEVKNPVRVVTSTVKIKDIKNKMVPVKTKDAIPKGKIFDVMKEIDSVEVTLPVEVGQVIIHNVLDTGVDIVSAKTVK
ncbi:DUF1667 domain-containing protein [Clostridium fallax]|uniref:CxxC motif-containing protein n=1 Tax=Clostridium fallax TaxID=1533 RepID=A0A1M4Y1P2_9CLOT|nr:DUF1667 domain-containing protein [Clostridium fallax]SHE99402.1 CxxC motif-containing protein [Clostridium fallax]SQB07764.1 molybdopterin oxidoreductase, 4Fe-4S cluster-binding subunit [Clostridium fallax]